jgi:capsular polysaccharide export protein
MWYHAFNFWNPLLFPRYRTHRPLISAIEYIGWGLRFSRMPWYKVRDRRTIADLMGGGQPYYLLPLQLDSDAQIRDHSPFNNMSEVIELVLRSFARHAPADARLVIKNHPLDTGFVAFHALIRRLARQSGLGGRVDYLESGDLDILLSRARGLVTVNSTVGLSSLTFDCPTMTLSDPVYNLPGLTFQGQLDDFWRQGSPPDGDLFRCFRNSVIHAAQINGGFYSRPGIALAVENSARVLTADRSPLEDLS